MKSVKTVGTSTLYQIVNANSGKCLDTVYGKTDKGTKFHQWHCDPNLASQLFMIRKK